VPRGPRSEARDLRSRKKRVQLEGRTHESHKDRGTCPYGATPRNESSFSVPLPLPPGGKGSLLHEASEGDMRNFLRASESTREAGRSNRTPRPPPPRGRRTDPRRRIRKSGGIDPPGPAGRPARGPRAWPARPALAGCTRRATGTGALIGHRARAAASRRHERG